MKKIKEIISETIYLLFIIFSFIFFAIVEILDISYNFFKNLFRFKKYNNDINDNRY